ncbi:MAG: N-acetyltransferase family protein [Verrucomicrobiota bacterium]
MSVAKRPSIHLRVARPDDTPDINEIYNQAIGLRFATADLEPITLAAREAWMADHPSSHYPVYVAEVGTRLAGWCSLSPYRPGRGALRTTAEISFYTHLAFLKTGIASALIHHAIGNAPELGLTHLFAIVLDINEPSLALLRKFQFEQWGHLPGVASIDGRSCGHLYLGRRLRMES